MVAKLSRSPVRRSKLALFPGFIGKGISIFLRRIARLFLFSVSFGCFSPVWTSQTLLDTAQKMGNCQSSLSYYTA
jgi:hypothetical protein